MSKNAAHLCWHFIILQRTLWDIQRRSQQLRLYSVTWPYSLTFKDPWITKIFAEYSQKDATFLNLFISVRRSTCFRRFFRPSTAAQNCTYSVRYLSDKYLKLYVQFWAPDDGRKNRLKHVERLTEINKLRKVASFLLYSENELAVLILIVLISICVLSDWEE